MSYKATIKILVRVGISSEGSTGEGVTSKLTYIVVKSHQFFWVVELKDLVLTWLLVKSCPQSFVT